MKRILTVEPFGVVLECPFEAERFPPGSQIVEIRPEDYGIGFGKLGVRAGIKSWQVSGIALLDPDRRRIVRRVIRTLRDAHSHPWDKLVTR